MESLRRSILGAYSRLMLQTYVCTGAKPWGSSSECFLSSQSPTLAAWCRTCASHVSRVRTAARARHGMTAGSRAAAARPGAAPRVNCHVTRAPPASCVASDSSVGEMPPLRRGSPVTADRGLVGVPSPVSGKTGAYISCK